MNRKTQLINFIIIFLNLMSPLISFAQPFVDPLNIKFQNFPKQPYAHDANNRVKSNLFEATILLPFVLKSKDVVLVIADATKINFNASGSYSASATLYSTSFAVGYDHQWKKEKWRTLALLIPKINSDYKNISSEDFQIGGAVLVNYKKNDHLKYHFGAYYNREFFGDFFVPLLGIEWKINDRMNLFGDLPSIMNFEYKVSKKLYAGAVYQSFLSTYRLSGGNYVRQGDTFLGDNRLKEYLNIYFARHFVVFVEAGQTLYRMFNFYDKNNNLRNSNSVFRKSNDGMFFTTGLAYRIRLD